MKKIFDLFTDEEKKHVSYFGSMLRRGADWGSGRDAKGSRLVCRARREGSHGECEPTGRRSKGRGRRL